MTAILDRFRPTGLHRAVDEVDRLTEQNRRLEAQLHRAAAGERKAIEAADSQRIRAIEAETVVACLGRQFDEATAENKALRIRLANAEAVTVGIGERDTSAVEDQATMPVGIDVKPLWEALGISPVLRVADAPPAADPRTPTWIPGQPNAETTQTFRVPAA
ncbi:hypothetical protein [Streptomyces sp900116325]|uniref:hypothetical protein n=1 Tax=Streptomyces sp. 900116325 TaxID=3154295 RepID=UPI0033A11BC1